MSSGSFWRSPSIVTRISPRARASPACIAGCWPKLRLKRTTRTRGSASCSRSRRANVPSRRAVVDEEELERAAVRLERRDRAPVELVDRRLLVEDRNDDGDVRRGLRLGGRRGNREHLGFGHRRRSLHSRSVAETVRARRSDRRPSRVAAATRSSSGPRSVPTTTSCSRSGSRRVRRACDPRCAMRAAVRAGARRAPWRAPACCSSGPSARRTPTWVFESGWYVNLQEPFGRTAEGVDTADQLLDLVRTRDGDWRWKDEDELAPQPSTRASSRKRSGRDPRRGRARDRRPIRSRRGGRPGSRTRPGRSQASRRARRLPQRRFGRRHSAAALPGIASAASAPAATTNAPTQVATTSPSLNVSADS